jgi:colanic acid/amylovoran biosynthesis protein
MTHPRRVTVTNVFGPLNRGDFELFHQLVKLLEAEPDVQIHAIARDPDGCRQHFPGVVFHAQPGVASEIGGRAGRIVALLRTIMLFLAARVAVVERLLPAPQGAALAAVRQADLVIACPGGYLTSTSWSFYPQVAQVAYAVRRARRVWLAPMSIGPAHRRLHRLLLGQTLRAASRIYVRESWSERFCQRLGAHAFRSADLAFRPARAWLSDDAPRQTPAWITATVVRWDFPGDPDPTAARERYHDAMAEALDTASTRLRLPVKLLLQVDNDRRVTESVAARLRANHEIVRVNTPEEYRRILSRSALMIGSRFHSAIFAMSVGCPTIVISYLPKARYMMEDMGLGPLVHDIDSVTACTLLHSLDLLDDAHGAHADQARAAILRQTEDCENPFVADLRSALRPEREAPHG